MYDPSNAGISPDGAVDLIRAGGVVIFPTETFFGMGGRALDADVTARIYRIKRRSNMNPLPGTVCSWPRTWRLTGKLCKPFLNPPD